MTEKFSTPGGGLNFPLRRVHCSKEKDKKEPEVTAQKLGESADKKAKEAQKKRDVATVKKLLIESKGSRKNLRR